MHIKTIGNIDADHITKSAIKLAIIVSDYNKNITSKLLEGALERLDDITANESIIHVSYVPGAVEIPLIAQNLAATKHYDGIVALSAVIQGETSHYDYVCNMVSQGILHTSLTFDIPIIFGVLTVRNSQQALDRLGGEKGHKGKEAIDAVIKMIHVRREISTL